MKNIKVEDLVVRTADYPSVARNATLREALLALEEAERTFGKKGGVPRTVLVLDDKATVIGKLTYWDVLRSLEPKYKFIGDVGSLCGWSPAFLKSMVANYQLLQNPFHDTCRKAAELKVDEIMTPLAERELLHREKEVVDAQTTLNEAIHLFVVGNVMTLFVCKEGRIIGVLRLSDVYKAIAKEIIRGTDSVEKTT